MHERPITKEHHNPVIGLSGEYHGVIDHFRRQKSSFTKEPSNWASQEPIQNSIEIGERGDMIKASLHMVRTPPPPHLVSNIISDMAIIAHYTKSEQTLTVHICA